MDDSRRSHLPCLLIDFLASLRDLLNGWLVLSEKRVISDLLSWKWERHKGQAKWILRKVVHAGGCVVAEWQVTRCPHPPACSHIPGIHVSCVLGPSQVQEGEADNAPSRDPKEGAKAMGSTEGWRPNSFSQLVPGSIPRVTETLF